MFDKSQKLITQLILATYLILNLQTAVQGAPQGWKDFLRELGQTAKEVSEVQNRSREKIQNQDSGRSNVQGDQPLSTKQLYDELLKSTVWIRTPKGHGTGWVYNREKGLIVTNHHVVEGMEYVSVFPPKFDDDDNLITDEVEYANYTRPLSGYVVDSEVSKDLALIQTTTKLPEFMQTMAFAETSPSPAERVHVIGGLPRQSEGMFVYANGHVRQVSRGFGAQPTQIWMVQTTIPTNPGNSGGAIVNDRAELVAVHSTGYYGVENVSGGTDIREVESYLRTIESLYPAKTAVDNYNIGVRHFWARRLDSAARYFTTALKLAPNMSAAFRMRGHTFRQKNDLELALNDFDSAVQANPADASAFHGRGLVHQSAGKLEKAKSDLSEAIRLDPTLEMAHFDRGLVNWHLKNYDESIKDYTRTISINRLNHQAYNSRGMVHLKKGTNDHALKDFESSASIQPTAVAYNNIGVAFQRMGNNRLAIDNFVKATRLDSKYYLAWENLGEIYYIEKQYENSISHAGYAIQLNPKSARALFIRAQAELVAGNKNHALTDINKAIRMYPKFANYYVLRSQINQQLGNTNEADKDYDLAAKLDPTTFKQRTVAKPVVPSQTNIQGRWNVQTKVRGVQFNSMITFSGSQYSYVSNWIDVTGRHGQTTGNGTFSTSNGTLTLRDRYGRTTNHAIGFNNDQLSLVFPGMNVNQSVLLYKS